MIGHSIYGEKQSAEFYLDVAKGKVAGHSLVHKFGSNDNVPNGVFEGVNRLSTAFNFLTSAQNVRVKAGNAADTVAGAGAQSITIEGLDDTGALAIATVATAGTSASVNFSGTWWRVFRMYVSACGTYGAANTGQVIIETVGAADVISIAATVGQSQYGAYSIPLGKTGYLLSALVQSDAAKAADFLLCLRDNLTDVSTPFSPRRLRFYWDGVLGQAPLVPHTPVVSLPALSDIWFEAQGGGAQTEVTVDMEILLVDN